jgi:16S rRNA (adenine1518-N6/adenine1519-N6)-dimethyltransferase
VSARRRAAPPARKSLGQHFLRDQDMLQRIALAVPDGGLPVVEIGPGTGELTSALLECGRNVIAVEIDARMLRHLRARFAGSDRLRLVHGDARQTDFEELTAGQAYVVAGNLPYFAANPIIRALLESPHQPRSAVLMLQKEVAQEVAAPSGKLSLLGISIRVYAEGEYLFDVPPEAFDPPPNVMSGVVRLTIHSRPLVPRERIDEFFDVVAKTFRNPRKQIHNALSRGLWLPGEAATNLLASAGIDATRRPETLSVEEWLRLVEEVSKMQA